MITLYADLVELGLRVLENPTEGEIAVAIAGPVGLTFGINFEDLTSWPLVWEITKKAFLTPYLVITVFISVVTFLIDPTTNGLNDSPQALQYKEPK